MSSSEHDIKVGRAKSDLAIAVKDLMDLTRDEDEVENEVEDALAEWYSETAPE